MKIISHLIPKRIFLFEFNDLNYIPKGLRTTLQDILVCVCSNPSVAYYSKVAQQVQLFLNQDTTNKIKHVVELGAGHAPLTRILASHPQNHSFTFGTVDLFPNIEAYQQLDESYVNVKPTYESGDYRTLPFYGEDTLLILSSSFHHIPYDERSEVIAHLIKGGASLIIAEPLQKNIISILATFLSLISGLFLPLVPAKRKTWLRRIFWCWIIPVAPLFIWWDGVVSCMRQWNQDDLESTSQKLNREVYCLEKTLTQVTYFFCESLTRKTAGI